MVGCGASYRRGGSGIAPKQLENRANHANQKGKSPQIARIERTTRANRTKSNGGICVRYFVKRPNRTRYFGSGGRVPIYIPETGSPPSVVRSCGPARRRDTPSGLLLCGEIQRRCAADDEWGAGLPYRARADDSTTAGRWRALQSSAVLCDSLYLAAAAARQVARTPRALGRGAPSASARAVHESAAARSSFGHR